MRHPAIVLASATALAAGLLCAPAVAQRPAVPNTAAAPGDFLQLANESAGTIKVEYFPAADAANPANGPQAAACINPKAVVRWVIDPAPGGKIAMQLMRGDQCGDGAQVACRSEISRAAGMNYVALRGDARSCAVVGAAAPKGGGLKAAGDCGPSGKWSPLTITNEYWGEAIWVTFYKVEPSIFYPNKIVGSGCWAPGETRMACVDRTDLIVRMEVKCSGYGPNHRCVHTPHCATRTVCDTGRDWSFDAQRRSAGGPARIDMGRSPDGYSLRNDGHLMCGWRRR